MSPVTCWTEPDRELLCGVGRGKDVEVGEGAESSSSSRSGSVQHVTGDMISYPVMAARFEAVATAGPEPIMSRWVREPNRVQREKRANCAVAAVVRVALAESRTLGAAGDGESPLSSLWVTPPNKEAHTHGAR
jgi:hypothetical protein